MDKKEGDIEFNGEHYYYLADGHYDAIVMGTGIKECILSGLLSANGWKVLTIDRNRDYGEECATYHLNDLYEKFKGETPSDSKLAKFGKNRDYNIDIIPKFLMACGNLVKMLLKTRTTVYMEFSSIEGSFVYSGKKKTVAKMPSTTDEALKTPLLGMMQKLKYRSFLSNVASMEIPGEDGVADDAHVPLDDMTMRELYSEYGLDENSQDFTGHAMALKLNDDYLDEPATGTVKAIKLYGYSVSQYGSSPFIYPQYGLSNLPEGFARSASVHGGVFMMNRDPEEIFYNEDGQAIGIRVEDMAASCKVLIGSHSYFPEEKSKVIGQVVRSICILDHPIAGTNNAKSAQIIIPAKQVKNAGYPSRDSDIYITCVSSDHHVCSKGFYVCIVATTVETKKPIKELAPGIELLGNICEQFDYVSDVYAPTHSGKKDKCFITQSNDATSHFETVADEVEALYKKITGKVLDLNDLPTDMEE